VRPASPFARRESFMTIAQIIYAALFRLSIITAGYGCVVLGYRLLVMGVMPGKGSEIDAQAGAVRLTLKNAAPGTIFAALGAFMIVAMLVQGNPEKKIVETETKEGTRRETTFRSEDADLESALLKGDQYENTDQLIDAVQAYAVPLKDPALPLGRAAGPLRAIAGVYLKQGRWDEALAYASLSDQADPYNAPGLALIARIQLARGDRRAALDAISRAARIDPAFSEERDRIKEQGP